MNNKRIFFILVAVLFGISASLAQVQDASSEFSYALKLYNQQFFDLSAQQFIKYYNEYPTSGNVDEAKFYAGMSLFKLKQYNKARVEFQSLALEYTKSPRAGEAWFKIGECYENLNNPAEAAKAYETVKILYPQDALAPQALLNSGKNYMLTGDYAKAKSVLSSILERYSDSQVYFSALVNLARVAYHNNEIDQAKLSLEKVIQNSKKEPELAEAFYTRGEIEMKQGYLKNAAENFGIILTKYPKTDFAAKAAYYSGQINVQQGEYDKAVDNFRKAESAGFSDESLPSIYALTGDALYLDQRYNAAELSYQKIKTDGNDSLYLMTQLKIAMAQRKQGFKSKSETTILNALNAKSSIKSEILSPVVNVALGWLSESGLNDKGISLIYKQLRNSTDDHENLKLVKRLAEFYQKSGQWRELIREVKPWLNVQTRFKGIDELLFLVATAHEKLGEYEDCAYYLSQIVKQYAASDLFEKANEKLQQINEYHRIDQSKSLKSQANLIGDLVMGKSKDQLSMELGKVYFSDLKDFENARKTFEEAVAQNTGKLGDAYLYLGKTYLKLANRPGMREEQITPLLRKAAQNFTKSVSNLATCSAPDEASWLMVITSATVDTLSLAKQKTYIETLIKKYPNSSFMEDWYKTLAYSLAFDNKYTEDSHKYFKLLIKDFKSSEQYTSYLLGYAKMIRDSDPNSALSEFKEIALDYSSSHEAAQALFEVARDYEDHYQYKEAASLFSRLADQYYYCDLADEAEGLLGDIYIKAGMYSEAIDLLKPATREPFLNDIVLSNEFLKPGVKNNLVYVGIAYARLGQVAPARNYFTRYLTLAADGKLRSRVSFEMADMFNKEGHYPLALDYYLNVGKDDPLYAEARLNSADILFNQRKYGEAAKIYEEASALYKDKPNQKDVDGKYIVSEIKTGNIQQGESLIKIYKKKYPDEQDYLARFTLELGDYYRNSKNFDKAVRYFSTVKKSYSKSSYVDDAEYYTALTDITLNKNDDAFEILTNFSKKYPNSDKLPFVMNTLGTLYFRVEKYDGAIAAFKTALKNSLDRELSRQVMGNLIKTYTLTSFWDAALGLARQYVSDYPDADDVLDKKIVIAQALINLNQFQNAVDYLKSMKLEADSEREPEIQFYIGEALLKAGQYEDAIAEFVKIPLMSKKTKLQWEASALYYSGQAYEKLGRVSDAIRMYKEIINRPGIDLILKKDAEKRISQIQG